MADGERRAGAVRPPGAAAPVLATLVLAFVLAAATSGYQRRGSEFVRYEGVNPGLDSTRVVVGGWPLPYLLDNPSISAVNSVSFTDGLLGVDDFRAWRFLADVLLFWGVLEALRRVVVRVGATRKGTESAV